MILDDHHTMTLLIFWGAVVAIIFVANFFAYRARMSHYRMIENLAEKGQTIPPQYMFYGRRYWRYGHPIASGIYLMCIGVALFVFLWAMTGGGNLFDGTNPYSNMHDHNWLPFVAIFPFMVGFARVLAGLVDRPPPPK